MSNVFSKSCPVNTVIQVGEYHIYEGVNDDAELVLVLVDKRAVFKYEENTLRTVLSPEAKILNMEVYRCQSRYLYIV